MREAEAQKQRGADRFRRNSCLTPIENMNIRFSTSILTERKFKHRCSEHVRPKAMRTLVIETQIGLYETEISI